MPKLIKQGELTVIQLIRGYRMRRREILKTLPPELLAEYRRLGKFIKDLEAERKDAYRVNPPADKGFFALPRIPLFVHKRKVIEFLRTREAATRGEISAATGTPPGSLSSLLKGKEFEQVRRGFWGLKKGGKQEKPGTSATNR